jgi:hypothetical protein
LLNVHFKKSFFLDLKGHFVKSDFMYRILTPDDKTG